MDLSLVPQLPPPQSQNVRFVYAQRRDHLKTTYTILVAFAITLAVLRILCSGQHALSPPTLDSLTGFRVLRMDNGEYNVLHPRAYTNPALARSMVYSQVIFLDVERA